MLIFKLLLAVPLVFLSACSSAPKQSDVAAEPVKPANAAKIVKQPVMPDKVQEGASFDPDVMFMVMTAEVAGQRGQYDVALEGYLEAARRVRDPRFAERAAAIALYIKDKEKADEAVNIWLQQDQNNQSALKIAAMSALLANDKMAAVGHLDKLLSMDPAGFEKTALELAAVLQKEGKNGVIYDTFDDLSKRHARNASLFLVKSLLALQLNNQGQASIDVQKALAIQPDWDKGLVLQAQLAAQSGDMDRAIANLKIAVAKRPEADKLQKVLAQLLTKNKNYEQAKQVYQQIIKANPEDTESRIAEGLIEMQLENYGQAEEVFKGLLDQPKWRNQACFYLAKLEESRGNTQEAVGWYEKVDDDALGLDAGIAAALLLAKDHQYQVAYSKLDRLTSRYPDQKLRLLVTQAELLNQQKNYQKAFDLLTDALKLHPDDKSLLYTRALIADRIGKLEVLESDLNKILQQDPDNAEALNALGYTLVERTNRYAEAEKYLRHALALSPDEGVILDSYGWLQFKLGKYEQSLGYLQRAYSKQQVGEIAAHLAEVLWVLGRKEEAKKIVDEALAREPEDEYLLQFKHRLLSEGLGR